MRDKETQAVPSLSGTLRANTQAYILDHPDGATADLLISANVADLVGKFVVVSGTYHENRVMHVDRIASLPIATD